MFVFQIIFIFKKVIISSESYFKFKVKSFSLGVKRKKDCFLFEKLVCKIKSESKVRSLIFY